MPEDQFFPHSQYLFIQFGVLLDTHHIYLKIISISLTICLFVFYEISPLFVRRYIKIMGFKFLYFKLLLMYAQVNKPYWQFLMLSSKLSYILSDFYKENWCGEDKEVHHVFSLELLFRAAIYYTPESHENAKNFTAPCPIIT